MTNKPLPENIQKIREAGARWLRTYHLNEVEGHDDDCILPWDECNQETRNRWLNDFDQLATELDKLGVVKAEGDTFKVLWQGLVETKDILTAVSFEHITEEEGSWLLYELIVDMQKAGITQVVSIVTGTPLGNK
jgi:hypothetical protein